MAQTACIIECLNGISPLIKIIYLDKDSQNAMVLLIFLLSSFVFGLLPYIGNLYITGDFSIVH